MPGDGVRIAVIAEGVVVGEHGHDYLGVRSHAAQLFKSIPEVLFAAPFVACDVLIDYLARAREIHAADEIELRDRLENGGVALVDAAVLIAVAAALHALVGVEHGHAERIDGYVAHDAEVVAAFLSI